MNDKLIIEKAIEVIKFYANIESWSTTDNHETYTNLEYDKDLGTGDFYTKDLNTNDSKVSGVRARKFLSEYLNIDIVEND